MGMRHNNLSRMVVKAMGLFGGVQVVNIVCSIVRTKLVAMWMGPTGVGLFGLWIAAQEMLSTATNLGIRTSSVRDITSSTATGNISRVSRIVAVVRKWSLWLGLFGALLTIALAPLLSQISFGDSNHIWGFVLLSVSILLISLMSGEHAILQGTARLKNLARASVWGSVAGLAVSVPMFYFWRIDSVLPSIVAYALTGAMFAYVYRNRDVEVQPLPSREVYKQGKDFVRLGIYMTIGTFLAILSSYVFSAYLNWRGGTEQMGFYQAGYTLVNRYVGLVLTALGVEYFPRLSKVAHSNLRLGLFVNQEIKIALLVLVPVVLVFMLLRGLVVELLYSKEFSAILTYVSWLLVGMILRATSWCMAFVILAKGDGKTYVITEAVSVAVGLALNIVAYHYYGLNGLGVSFVIWYLIYNIIVGAVYFSRYKLHLHKSTVMISVFAVAVSIMCMLSELAGHQMVSLAIALASTGFCLFALKKILW